MANSPQFRARTARPRASSCAVKFVRQCRRLATDPANWGRVDRLYGSVLWWLLLAGASAGRAVDPVAHIAVAAGAVAAWTHGADHSYQSDHDRLSEYRWFAGSAMVACSKCLGKRSFGRHGVDRVANLQVRGLRRCRLYCLVHPCCSIESQSSSVIPKAWAWHSSALRFWPTFGSTHSMNSRSGWLASLMWMK